MGNDSAILPGATIGVLGSGQLGRMFAIAARRMGYRVQTFSPDTDTPTGQIADVEVVGDYHDLEAVRNFARGVDVVTFEFENVPTETAGAAAEFAPVRPAGEVLHVTQHRLREKAFLAKHGFPVTGFRTVRSQADLDAATDALGFPSILKTAGFGYDGKGQARLANREAGVEVMKKQPDHDLILEAFVDFEREVSVVAARGSDGAFAHWGVIENGHRNHILDVSVSPAAVSEKVAKEAVEITRSILETLGVVGVLCVEFFLTKSGKLVVNELAPRPHNSGHLTVDGSVTSQFEQQLRAVCNLPLGSTEMRGGVAMANLLGDIWEGGTPDWAGALADARVKLHLYGKMEARAGRKMGHLTAVAETPGEARRAVVEARERLSAGRGVRGSGSGASS
ncbi:MAG TPA: 5-(carboxyamino)imidazole ribonucleotide synthase [Tepidisphaeraceae bacterium]|nr:5-(carboxyamino)imidazole ribonucleotide synthase [Tepidisphaeraceae bacterium]